MGTDSGRGWEGKVRSIFKRARRVDLSDAYYEEFALLVEEKLSGMASAKDKVTSRVSVLVVYKDCLRFLLGVLDGIDETKLKR